MYADDDSDDYSFETFGGGGGAFGAFGPMRGYNARQSRSQRQFTQFYSAYPIAAYMDNKADANHGGKIFMPPSALEEISQLEVVYPLLFKLQTDHTGEHKRTHCGVLEFTAEEGRVYLPQWMMATLGLQPGAAVEVLNVALLHGSLVKLQPQSVDFLDISDHRAVLENALRRFSALTVGDIISFEYNAKEYQIAVIETQPSPSAINIVETDLSVDFAPPIGYIEPTRAGSSSAGSVIKDGKGGSSMARDIKIKEEKAKEERENSRFAAFRGTGSRLKGGEENSGAKSYAGDVQAEKVDTDDGAGEPVPLDLPIGTLFFGYPAVLPPGAENKDDAKDDTGNKFHGSGQVLRQRRKR
ncbi:ubiquitin fusion degradation protein [Kickxella alabastrina]|uniref:Ubiquitin fusion degradation protein n=1 Tax=Kickxella alabastrina TaxID=61397 RepID=A0ACC1I9A5_9FUNG|nr:ubiquitin fusion degradation protein [Kickxella alabastrina]